MSALWGDPRTVHPRMQDLRTSETSKVIALLALERGVLTPDAALALIDGASSEADLVAKLDRKSVV